MLKFLQGLREPGVLSANALAVLRSHNLSFSLNDVNGYNGFASQGARYGEEPGCAQFAATQAAAPWAHDRSHASFHSG